VISRRFVIFSTFVTALCGDVDGTDLFPNQQRSAAAIELSGSDAPVGLVTHSFVRQSPTWGARHLAATIWYPVAGEPLAGRSTLPDAPPSGRGPFPVIVYSHGGCGGSPQAIAPIATSIARTGFVFVQFPHPGSTAEDCASEGDRYARGLLERPDDIVQVLDSLRQLNNVISWRLHGIVDSDRVGIIGHSQGGQTALMMPARDSRVKATVSLSPSVAHPDTPAAVWQAIAMAHAPVMIMRGTRDGVWTSEGALRAYDLLPSDVPRAYLEIEGMGHSPSTADDIATVLHYVTAFFRFYVQGDRGAGAALVPTAAPANVLFKSSRFP
jgi:dipeptidyl aminopeptidase/acylaminoacyl peptidase